MAIAGMAAARRATGFARGDQLWRHLGPGMPDVASSTSGRRAINFALKPAPAAVSDGPHDSAPY